MSEILWRLYVVFVLTGGIMNISLSVVSLYNNEYNSAILTVISGIMMLTVFVFIIYEDFKEETNE